MATITIRTTTTTPTPGGLDWSRAGERLRSFAQACAAVVADVNREPADSHRYLPHAGIDTFHRAGASRF